MLHYYLTFSFHLKLALLISSILILIIRLAVEKYLWRFASVEIGLLDGILCLIQYVIILTKNRSTLLELKFYCDYICFFFNDFQHCRGRKRPQLKIFLAEMRYNSHLAQGISCSSSLLHTHGCYFISLHFL